MISPLEDGDLRRYASEVGLDSGGSTAIGTVMRSSLVRR
jgi:hypothetical protein